MTAEKQVKLHAFSERKREKKNHTYTLSSRTHLNMSRQRFMMAADFFAPPELMPPPPPPRPPPAPKPKPAKRQDAQPVLEGSGQAKRRKREEEDDDDAPVVHKKEEYDKKFLFETPFRMCVTGQSGEGKT